MESGTIGKKGERIVSGPPFLTNSMSKDMAKHSVQSGERQVVR